MKRLYYLFHGVDSARTISDDLINAGVNAGQMHFMNHDVASLDAADVHQADIFDERDIPHRGIWGAIIGLGSGVLFAAYLLTSELSPHLSLSVFAAVCALFCLMGAWVGGFIGISHDNHHIARFHDALESGDTLLMVDAYTENEASQLRQIMHTRHLEASYEGEESEYKVFL